MAAGGDRRVSVLVAVVLLAGIATVTVHDHTWQRELATHPDEAAHFVTGVMVLDYLRGGLGTHPLAFAEDYYARYPKVAFGHWPPLFHLLQALWYGVVGASVQAALALIVAIAAGTLMSLVRRLARLHGTTAALAGAVLLPWFPLVREALTSVLADMLAAWFTLLALLALADARQHSRRPDFIRFALWTSAAMLTKTSAATLLAVALLALRRRLWATLGWWGVTLATAACLAMGTLVAYRGVAAFDLDIASRWPGLVEAHRLVPWPVLLGAVVGALPLATLSPERAAVRHLMMLYLAIAIPAQLLARDSIEPRYFLPLLFPLLLLFAEGLRLTLDRCSGYWKPAVALAIAASCGIAMPGFDSPVRRGYAAAARTLAPQSAVLIWSDAAGEGAFLAARLLQDRERRGLVVRGTKTLLDTDWMGRNPVPLIHTGDDLQEVVDRHAVQFIVLDPRARWIGAARQIDDVIQQAIQDSRWFRRTATSSRLAVYENLSAERRAEAEVSLNLSRSLGRSLQRRIAVGNGGPVTSDRRIALPYRETFRQWRGRWIFESHGEPATLHSDSSSPDGAGASVVLTKEKKDAFEYLTQIYLPAIALNPGGSAEVSLWLRAEPAVEVELTFTRRLPPYHLCGLAQRIRATPTWVRHTVRFQVLGDDCTPEATRLSLNAGNVAGRLWLSGVAIGPAQRR